MAKLSVVVTPIHRTRVAAVPNVLPSASRAVAVLIVEGDASIDAAEAVERLNAAPESDAKANKERRDLWSRFEHWLAGGTGDRFFHGWGDPEYRELFVFKWTSKRDLRRLYGFLCHPRKSDRAFQVCVLFAYESAKGDWETSPSVKTSYKALVGHAEVLKAIAAAYPEPKPARKGKPWLN